MLFSRQTEKDMIERFYDNLEKFLKPNKVLMIYGPRQVGKTTLIKEYLKRTTLKYKFDSGDNLRIQELLSSLDFQKILSYAEGYELLVIDEAQNIPNIGKALKILVDETKGIKIIITGSSSFNLSQNTGEPLTGRKKTLTLYPISQFELRKKHNKYDLQEKLEEFLIYGSYPEVVTAKNIKTKIEILNELADSYLLKDILSFFSLKKPHVILNLLKLLAFQIGSQVSLNELALNLKVDIKTVINYLDILEKAFVIKKITAFSRNLRNEITKSCKYYFLDIGIRNAVINQFNKIDLRNDIGQLWENFLFIERTKKLSYKGLHTDICFWRTYAGNEIDFVEEKDGKINAFEAKWRIKTSANAPKEWRVNYKSAVFKVIHKENYLDFVS